MGRDGEEYFLKNISEILSDVKAKLSRIAGYAEDIKQTNEEGFAEVSRAVASNTQAQAEMKIMEHMSKVHSTIPQIEAEKNRIDREKEELQSRLESIEERYSNKQNELQEKAEERIREMGQHIFEIQEKEFEQAVERPYLENVTETWSELKSHNIEVRDRKEEKIESKLKDMHETIDDFIDQRNEVLSKIDEHRIDKQTNRERTLNIPFWVIEVERDGKKEKIVVPPSKMKESKDSVSGFQFEEKEGFREFLNRLKDRNVDTEESKTLDTDYIEDKLRKKGDSVLSLISFSSESSKALDNQIEVKEEV